MMRVGGLGASGPATRLWQIALLTAAGAIGSACPAEAALFYWSDSGYYSQPVPMAPPRRLKARHRQAKKIEAPGKESAKPQGPLIIAISIEKQNLKIYDANGFFAETPVSTGMKGHPTPMGVFSVIQKHKLHHSNIYSGAPMPYMQRITWSGVAIHAGVLPGYPASHGCIRMPMAFAIKMWNWTKMGARVLITPGEMTPASFSHPLLVAQKAAPQPNAAEPQADAPSATKSDKASDAGPAILPAVSEARLELRSTVGHDDGVKPVMGEPPAPASLREQTRTADASGGMRATKPLATMNDASAGSNASPREEAAARPDSAPPVAEDAASPKSGATASTDGKPAEIKPSEAATVEIRSAETAATDDASKTPDQVQAPVQASGDTALAETTATGSVTAEAKGDEKKAEAKADDVKAEAPKPDALKSGERPNEKPDDTAGTVTDIGTSVPVPAASKPNPAAAAAPKRTGQIAVFVSRKDSKLYVRQNFAPLFEAPVTIAPSDRPLGTHVFTAQVDKGNHNIVRWSVVSLPVLVRYAEQRDEDERNSRRRKMAGAVEIKPMPVPDTPTEALDRLAIPADAMARITDAISTGGSIIVSDQGIRAGETGEGTDFIVSLR
jgi:hypothetical protein